MDRTPADRPDHPRAAERFNEEQATYAVRGADQPDLDKGVAAIREVLRTLPVRPGVYRMQDSRGDVLYVGKARTLKNRVTNYTQVAKLPKRLQLPALAEQQHVREPLRREERGARRSALDDRVRSARGAVRSRSR